VNIVNQGTSKEKEINLSIVSIAIAKALDIKGVKKMKTNQSKIEQFPINLWAHKWVVLVRPTPSFEKQIIKSSGFEHYPFNIEDLMESFVEIIFVVAETENEAREKATKALKESGFPNDSYGSGTWFVKFKMLAFKAPPEYELMFIEPVKIWNHNSLVFKNQLSRMW
jgi:hypothetical protein